MGSFWTIGSVWHVNLAGWLLKLLNLKSGFNKNSNISNIYWVSLSLICRNGGEYWYWDTMLPFWENMTKRKDLIKINYCWTRVGVDSFRCCERGRANHLAMNVAGAVTSQVQPGPALRRRLPRRRDRAHLHLLRVYLPAVPERATRNKQYPMVILKNGIYSKYSRSFLLDFPKD